MSKPPLKELLLLDDAVNPPFAAEGLASQPGPALRASEPAARRKRILVADDDLTVRAALAAVLESEGYDVDEAADGREAGTRVAENPPDLVLLDLSMPQVDGWTAFTQLDRRAPLLPVIVITARPSQYKEAVRLGVDVFMEKPLSIPVLLRAVRRLVNETPGQHLRRITDRGFVTRLLENGSGEPRRTSPNLPDA